MINELTINTPNQIEDKEETCRHMLYVRILNVFNLLGIQVINMKLLIVYSIFQIYTSIL